MHVFAEVLACLHMHVVVCVGACMCVCACVCCVCVCVRVRACVRISYLHMFLHAGVCFCVLCMGICCLSKWLGVLYSALNFTN